MDDIGEDWNFLLSEFRRLGGIAENVCQKEGQFGRGIFSINSKLRSRIFTPSNLMINSEDIVLEADQLRINKDKNYNHEIRVFFNYYQDNFSWGGGGKETTESFEKGLRLFSYNLKKLIKKYLLIDLEERHKGEWSEVIKKQFLNSRRVAFENCSAIAPVWDLVNHEVISLPFLTSLEGISTPNYSPTNGELTFNYSNKSPLNRFFSHGFFAKETIIFSFPFSITCKKSGINFICQGEEITDDSMLIERSGNKILIKGLPIADLNNPLLPTKYFQQIVSRIGDTNIPNDILSSIFEFNILSRREIIQESELVDHEVSNMLSEIIYYEINLISLCD